MARYYGNRLSKGPAWTEAPFTHITHEFWPDKSSMLAEAISVRDDDEHRFLLPLKFDNSKPHLTQGATGITLDWSKMQEKTPLLKEYYENFLNWIGSDLGRTTCHYFHIDAGATYSWHVDNVQSGRVVEGTSDGFRRPFDTSPVNCCINLVITDDQTTVEFNPSKIVGYEYECGILNTSEYHRVYPSKYRVLARISFFDLLYEEVVHKVRRQEKKLQ